jgi:hypothetical protein
MTKGRDITEGKAQYHAMRAKRANEGMEKRSIQGMEKTIGLGAVGREKLSERQRRGGKTARGAMERRIFTAQPASLGNDSGKNSEEHTCL